MSGEKIIDILIGTAVVVIILCALLLAYIIFTSKPVIERNIKTTCVIPATEWRCFVSTETKEITCKGLIIKDNEANNGKD